MGIYANARLEFFHAYISEKNLRTVSQNTNMARFPAQSWMALPVHRPVFRGFGKVAVQDYHTVQCHLDSIALHADLLLVPFAYRFHTLSFCRYDSVGRPV